MNITLAKCVPSKPQREKIGNQIKKKNFDTACNDIYNANAICPNTELVENGKVGKPFFELESP
jgi:hypothetical protein